MKSQARVVVIGGGIAGCSTLYHLTQEGWSDVVLVERDELTSGTTWHSAAQVTNFGMSQVMIGLKSHSIKLYKELAADPEYPVGYNFGDGGIRLQIPKLIWTVTRISPAWPRVWGLSSKYWMRRNARGGIR